MAPAVVVSTPSSEFSRAERCLHERAFGAALRACAWPWPGDPAARRFWTSDRGLVYFAVASKTPPAPLDPAWTPTAGWRPVGK